MKKLTDIFPKRSSAQPVRQREVRQQQPRRSGFLTPAKLGLVGFLVFCLAIIALDMRNTNDEDVANIPLPAETDGLPAAADAQPAEQQPDAEPEAAAAASMFAGYRMDREQSRSEELALLQQIIDDPNSSAQIRDEAEQRRLTISASIEQEALAESLLNAKGFGETVVLLGATQATVVCSIQLDAVKATQIAEIVGENCGVGFENVVIVNR